MRLELRAKGPVKMVDGQEVRSFAAGHHAQVLLDGNDISASCRELVLRMVVDEVVEATLTIVPDEIVVDGDVVTYLEAFAEFKKDS